MAVLKCPNCGLNVELDGRRDFGFCIYCGTRILMDHIVPETIRIFIEYPDTPVKKGKFTYFRTYLGKQDLPLAHLGDRLEVDTTSGLTSVVVRQMTYGHTCSAEMELHDGDTIRVMVIDEQLVLKQIRG